MNRNLYPKNWRQISHRIRFERAEGKCEECGAPHNGFRDDNGDWYGEEFGIEFPHMTEHMSKIVLTTAHLGIPKPDGSPGDRSDTMDCREENLKALCQRCHLAFDRSDNINRRRINRRKSLVRAGQLEMF
jgi:hypothetical protein